MSEVKYSKQLFFAEQSPTSSDDTMLPKIIYPAAVSFAGKDLPSPLGYPRGGYIQVTYLLEETVLQISPSLSIENKDSQPWQTVLNRWVITNKGFAHSERMKLLRTTCQTHTGDWNVEVPDCIGYGKQRFCREEDRFEYWLLKRIKSVKKFADLTNSETESLRFGLLKFLADMHTIPFHGSLREYYQNRLTATRYCLEKLAEESAIPQDHLILLNKIGKRISDEIEEAVASEEPCATIHGDFREVNILISGDRTASVLDFEQGLFGGDPIADLWKFGTAALKPLSSNPNELQHYARILTDNGGTVSPVLTDARMMEKRLWLIRFDTLISMLIFRSLMGWSFDKKIAPDGNELRGTEFIYNFIKEVFSTN